jgi:hypothetical protein
MMKTLARRSIPGVVKIRSRKLFRNLSPDPFNLKEVEIKLKMCRKK